MRSFYCWCKHKSIQMFWENRNNKKNKIKLPKLFNTLWIVWTNKMFQYLEINRRLTNVYTYKYTVLPLWPARSAILDPTPAHSILPQHRPILGAFERPKPTNTNVLRMRVCVHSQPVSAQFDLSFQRFSCNVIYHVR